MTGPTFLDGATWRRRLLAVLSFAALGALLAGCGRQVQPGSAAIPKPSVAAPDAAQTERFIEQHWARPLAPQGNPPSAVAAQGITLAPESCGTCHAQQFKDWRSSLHSAAMGPGLMGQLVAMPPHARDEHQNCIRCHAPLAEQADSLVLALEKGPGQGRAGTSGSAIPARPLHEQGLVCAACHVRAYQWNGPARRDGSVLSGDSSSLPHGGWKANSAFESSQFCAACHQFKDDEFALNGKLLENTYREWQGSRYAREGKACQSCHMPDRRHLWRGIHDPAMVKQGLDIRTGTPATAEGQLSAQLSVTNSGVGHYFPTYVTPQAVLRGYQVNASGRRIDGTAQEYVVGRQVALDLSREIADTRIAPDAQAVFDYRAALHSDAAALVFEVEVRPDAFYLEFYRALLQDNATSGESRRLLSQARDHAAASPYLLFSRRLPLAR